MPEIVLHHYPLSLFAEKIRRVLAYKQLDYRAVEQPPMMPKPDLTPLTGGYRRIPVMQVGADIYCDTACIARALERLHPARPILPEGQAGLAGLLEDWADRRLTSQIVPQMVLELLPNLPPGFLDDRAKMSPGLARESLARVAPHAWSQAQRSLDRLELALQGRAFALGDAFTLADAACYHPLWFLRHSPRLFAAVEARPALASWFRRVTDVGPGAPRPMATDEALALARDATPVDVDGPSLAEDGLERGREVAIVADDYGAEETRGTLARLTTDEVAIVREDPRLGALCVHFPRAGYRITAT